MKINIPVTDQPRVVIIGCGFGGLRLAKNLRHANVQVVLVDRNNYHNFQPLLYQVATGGLEADSIAYPIRKIFTGQQNFFFRMAEVTAIHPEINQVQTSIGDIRYDYLVISSGSATNFFGNKQIEENAMQIKSIPSALNLRSLIFQNFEKALLMTREDQRDPLMDIVVVGGGPTGVELSGTLAEMKKYVLPKDYPELDMSMMDIYLMEAGPTLLNGMSKESQEKALNYLKDMGVHVLLSSPVESFEANVIKYGGGKTINASTMIWAAGVFGANIPGLDEPAVARNKRVNVNTWNQVVGYSNIFAIGDLANMETKDFPKGHPMVAPVAIQQAELLAENLSRIIAGQTPREFVYKNKGVMATVGRNRAVVDLPKFKFGGFFAWLVWMFVHLMTLVGFRNKLVTFVGWVWNYFAFDTALRLIIRPYLKETRDGKQQQPSPPQPPAAQDGQTAKPEAPQPAIPTVNSTASTDAKQAAEAPQPAITTVKPELSVTPVNANASSVQNATTVNSPEPVTSATTGSFNQPAPNTFKIPPGTP